MLLINILGVGASRVPGEIMANKKDDRPTNVENGRRPARAGTSTGRRHFGSLLPETCAIWQTSQIR